MQPAVEVRDLRVRYGAVDAVAGLDLSLADGETLALVGRNGAGKSTTLRVLAGVAPADGGSVHVLGLDLRADPVAVKRVVGYCPDVGGLVPRATPWEHLQLAARLRGLDDWHDRATDLLERFDLLAAAHRVTAGFSHGMGRRLSVVLAALHSPAVLLLDEPFDGVDPLGVEATLTLVRELQDAGSAVIVSTHLVELALQVCQGAVVLRGGRAVASSAGPIGSEAAGDVLDLRGAEGAERYRELLR
ncbi:ABC transporter ATP-binding protein [Spongisporangium articulatum]|uniref:ABC transporter ATP-binding protein n=1 Tax=Spongisporangium articulatum TaxID=3362603 RepID=A0ABW8ASU2_9ACTN